MEFLKHVNIHYTQVMLPGQVSCILLSRRREDRARSPMQTLIAGYEESYAEFSCLSELLTPHRSLLQATSTPLISHCF